MTSRANTVARAGHEKLWWWFGGSYASFLTLPRVLMHAMPDEWQGKMADLLDEYDSAFPNQPNIGTRVQATRTPDEERDVSILELLVSHRHDVSADSIPALQGAKRMTNNSLIDHLLIEAAEKQLRMQDMHQITYIKGTKVYDDAWECSFTDRRGVWYRGNGKTAAEAIEIAINSGSFAPQLSLEDLE